MKSSNSTSGYISKRIKDRVSNIFCIAMFISKLFTIANGWKEPKCSSIDELNFFKNVVYSQKYYSFFKRRKIMIHATT